MEQGMGTDLGSGVDCTVSRPFQDVKAEFDEFLTKHHPGATHHPRYEGIFYTRGPDQLSDAGEACPICEVILLENDLTLTHIGELMGNKKYTFLQKPLIMWDKGCQSTFHEKCLAQEFDKREATGAGKNACPIESCSKPVSFRNIRRPILRLSDTGSPLFPSLKGGIRDPADTSGSSASLTAIRTIKWEENCQGRRFCIEAMDKNVQKLLQPDQTLVALEADDPNHHYEFAAAEDIQEIIATKHHDIDDVEHRFEVVFHPRGGDEGYEGAESDDDDRIYDDAEEAQTTQETDALFHPRAKTTYLGPWQHKERRILKPLPFYAHFAPYWSFVWLIACSLLQEDLGDLRKFNGNVVYEGRCGSSDTIKTTTFQPTGDPDRPYFRVWGPFEPPWEKGELYTRTADRLIVDARLMLVSLSRRERARLPWSDPSIGGKIDTKRLIKNIVSQWEDCPFCHELGQRLGQPDRWLYQGTRWGARWPIPDNVKQWIDNPRSQNNW